MIKEFLESEKIDEKGPTDWHFAQLDKIVQEYKLEDLCQQILNEYELNFHDRDQVTELFNMLIWVNSEMDLEISRFFRDQIKNRKLINVRLSPKLEWFPFGTPEQTLNWINKRRTEFPELTKELNYWEERSVEDLKTKT
ncbi:MAG: hypothetical protein AAF693_11040 [Bacteroidota bacterium]